MPELPPIRVLSLQVEHIKRVEAVAIDPADDVVVLSGDNGEGKSSVLDSIVMALGGKAAEAEVPINGKHATGTVFLVLGARGEPAIKVTKEFRRGGASRLRVEKADGSAISSPQDFLDELVGHGLAFRPFEFAEPRGAKTPEARRKAQVEMLLRACPLPFDIDEHDARRKKLKDVELRDANRDLAAFEAAVGPMIGADEAVPALVDTNEADGDLDRARDHNAAIDVAKQKLEMFDKRAAEVRTQIQVLRDQIAAKETQLAKFDAEGRPQMIAAAEAAKIPVEEIVAKRDAARVANEARIPAELRNQTRAVERARRVTAQEKYKAAFVKTEALAAQVKVMDAAKESALASAKFPAGLSLDEAGVVMNGLPFDQASTAQRHEASLAVGAALSGALKVLIEEDGNSLDAKAMERTRAFAREHGFQVWIERVARDQTGCIVIENGRVADAPVPAGAGA